MTSEHEDKAAYSSQEEAQAAATVAKSRFAEPAQLVAYRCRECDLWHLATQRDDD